MRHRIKAGKVGSFTPEKQKVEIEQLEDREVAEDVGVPRGQVTDMLM